MSFIGVLKTTMTVGYLLFFVAMKNIHVELVAVEAQRGEDVYSKLFSKLAGGSRVPIHSSDLRIQPTQP